MSDYNQIQVHLQRNQNDIKFLKCFEQKLENLENKNQ